MTEADKKRRAWKTYDRAGAPTNTYSLYNIKRKRDPGEELAQIKRIFKSHLTRETEKGAFDE